MESERVGELVEELKAADVRFSAILGAFCGAGLLSKDFVYRAAQAHSCDLDYIIRRVTAKVKQAGGTDACL